MKEVSKQFTNRRGHTLAPIACIVALTALMTACVATKSDVRILRTDMQALEAHQDSLYRESLRTMSAQADSVRMLTDLLRTTRGQLANQIRQIQDMVVTLQELSGQSAQSVRQLQERIQQQAAPPPQAAQAAPGGTSADDLYQLGMSKLQDKSAAAARAAFQQLLADYPQHEKAADAQYGIAQTYELDEALSNAVDSYVRVSEAYPTSPRAPDALYRAGQLSEERKERTAARRYYTMITSRYAGSPAASLASKRLKALK